MTLEDTMKQVLENKEAFVLSMADKQKQWDLATECFRLSKAHMDRANDYARKLNSEIQKANELSKQGADIIERMLKPKIALVVNNDRETTTIPEQENNTGC